MPLSSSSIKEALYQTLGIGSHFVSYEVPTTIHYQGKIAERGFGSLEGGCSMYGKEGAFS